jgi:uncharacterized protein YutE (UPF0331/DUF86 family)
LVDRYIVDARIAKIREYVALLRKIYGQTNKKKFIQDPLVYGNAERYLQLAIQCVLDISNHIVADMRLSIPDDNRQLFELLVRHKILSRSLASTLTNMAGFRNVLVHEYLEIDRKLVFEVLEKNLGDFEKFIRAVAKLL